MEQVKIVITGHIDHGKSTLIGRLLYDTNSLSEGKVEEIKRICKDLDREMEFAYLIDNLEEEREQQLTIDTAQLFFKTKKRDYVIIDAPGHKEFIKNMITGASQADLAILMIDANEGIKEQTTRHPYIIKMLGIKNLIVAVNKMDLIKYEESKFNDIKKEILDNLLKIGLVPGLIIPVSALKGENILNRSKNISWYDGLTLLEALDKFEYDSKIKNSLRFAVQDVYNFDDKKIIAGKIISGKLKVNDIVTIMPLDKKAKVKSIEAFNSKKDEALEGENIGIIINEDYDIKPGMIFCNEYLPKITKKFNAKLFWMVDLLNLDDELVLRCATQEVKCRVKEIKQKINSSTLEVLEINSDNLKETEVGEVVIESDNPLVVDNYEDLAELGRFVIIKNYDIAGAGIIS